MLLQKMKNSVLALHNDENGDIPVGTIMVIGLIAIPLVIALILFKDDMLGWLKGETDEFIGTDASGGYE